MPTVLIAQCLLTATAVVGSVSIMATDELRRLLLSKQLESAMEMKRVEIQRAGSAPQVAVDVPFRHGIGASGGIAQGPGRGEGTPGELDPER